jgi:hypothetical protein
LVKQPISGKAVYVPRIHWNEAYIDALKIDILRIGNTDIPRSDSNFNTFYPHLQTMPAPNFDDETKAAAEELAQGMRIRY